MSEIKEGDKVVIETEVTAVHPEWFAVRINFGRMVQNVRVAREMVRPAEAQPEPVEVEVKIVAPETALTPAQVKALDRDGDGKAGGAPKGGNRKRKSA